MKGRPLICNLWHIKQTNGLFYYALDYVRAIEPPTVVYVRAALFEPASAALKGHDVRCASAKEIVRILVQALLCGRYVFTPTSHPVPFHRHQLVVIHDDYPFLGKAGRLKRLMFRFGLQSAHCEVGHINHSTALDALSDCCIKSTRLRYMPNKAPDDQIVANLRAARAAITEANRLPARPLRIALFGSDSPKKRYEELFRASRSLKRCPVQFEVYGHSTEYFLAVRSQFPDLRIVLVPSSEVDIQTFLQTIDAVVSVAEHEGFGRPIAIALAAGLRCFLLESKVFSEFFSRSTTLYRSIAELVEALDTFSPSGILSLGFQEQADITQSFELASRYLNLVAAMESRSK